MKWQKKARRIPKMPPEKPKVEKPAPPPKPEVAEKVPEKPAAPTVVVTSEASKVYEYLKAHGPTMTPMIARELKISLSTVIKALRELAKVGRVKLSG